MKDERGGCAVQCYAFENKLIIGEIIIWKK